MQNLVEIAPMRGEGVFTAVILGPARSGTSLLAGGLCHGGIDFGANIHPIYECQELPAAMEARRWAEFDAIVARRNAMPVWGWKRPSIINHFAKVAPRLRNPVWLVVARDVAAIAQRNGIAYAGRPEAGGPLPQMLTNLEILRLSLTLPARTGRPMAVVSAEKMFADPAGTVEAVAHWLGLALDGARIARFLARGNADYDRAARARD